MREKIKIFLRNIKGQFKKLVKAMGKLKNCYTMLKVLISAK